MIAVSELAEIRNALASIRDAQTKTATDVGWIRQSMERGSKRMDEHDKRLGSLERWRTWSAGIGMSVAALLGLGHLPKP